MTIDRRELFRRAIAGAASLEAASWIGSESVAAAARRDGALTRHLDTGWSFGRYVPGSTRPSFKGDLGSVNLPHCVKRLGWRNWDPRSWQDQWVYRRRFAHPAPDSRRRVFLEFERSMTETTSVLNGEVLGTNAGGYVPFSYEITDRLRNRNNVLAVKIDGRWEVNAPPGGGPNGPREIDWLQPAGLYGRVSLRSMPRIFLSDVFAKPKRVLTPNRRVDLVCNIDADHRPARPLRLKAVLRDRNRVLATASRTVKIERVGRTRVGLTLTQLASIDLWELDDPKLYTVEVKLLRGREVLHDERLSIGFRDARFEEDGFYLNGNRVQLFGLNRHQLFPFRGMAMPDRVQRRDAWILKRQLNCNFVRCSHYPQSPAFLNACDELGLLVWEEIPGWHYLGDARWRKQALRDVRKMIVRDRNHPSIVVWGVRVNESRDDPLHKRMERMAGKFDPTRPTSGAAPSGKHTRSGWMHDIYGQNDYKRDADTNSVAIRRPLAGIPYLVTESVGQRDYAGGTGFTQRYGRGANPKMQYRQALFHAQAHDRAAGSNIAGLIGWCAFDYQSVRNDNDTGLKRPGVMDCFRETKLGASIYRSQVDPATKAVIEPNFYWYFRDPTTNGPGDGAMICSNCDRLEIYVDNQHHSSLEPARHKFPRLPFAPFFADLGSVDRKGDPQLRIDGYVAGKLVRRRLLSSDPAFDHLVIKLDDDRIRSDGVDATRLAIRIVDKYGTIRGLKGGKVDLAISGPGVLIGPQEFNLTPNGGVGAVWIRSRNGRGGTIKIVASHKKYDPVSTKLVSR